MGLLLRYLSVFTLHYAHDIKPTSLTLRSSGGFPVLIKRVLLTTALGLRLQMGDASPKPPLIMIGGER